MMPDGNFQSILSEQGVPSLPAEHVFDLYFLIADANRDRAVGINDYGLLAANFNSTGKNFSQGDFDLDGDVDTQDYAILAANYGRQIPEPITEPSKLQVYALSSSSMQLNWTAPDGDTPDGYRVFRGADGINFTQIAEVDASTFAYTDTGLLDGTKYWYRIRPFTTAYGNGETTEKQSAVTVLPAPYDVDLQATASASATLTWTLPSLSADLIEIQMRPPGETWADVMSLDGNVTSAQITGLTSTQAYEFRLRRLNTSCSAQSAYTLSLTLGAQSTPSTPSTPVATVETDGSVSLAWAATSGATAYVVERALNSAFTNGLVTLGNISRNDLSFNDSLTIYGVTYHYRLRAFDRGNLSGVSSNVTATAQEAAPTAPGGVYAVPVSEDEIQISWNDAANETGYLLQRSTYQDFSADLYLIRLDADTVQFVDTVPADDIYYYRLSSEFSTGISDSQFSETAPATLPLAVALQPSDAIATSIGVSGTVLSWSDEADNETEYRLSRSTSSDMSTDLTVLPTLPPNTTTYTDASATGTGPYYYHLAAVNVNTNFSSAGSVNVENTTDDVQIEVIRATGGGFRTPSNDVYLSNTPVHVRAAAATLAQFDPLVCRYTWKFMVGTTLLASARGFNASYSFTSSNLATSPKNCTIRLDIDTPRGGSQSVTTSDFDTTSANVSVKYAKDSREVVTISSTSWSSIQSTINAKRATNGRLSNVRFLFSRANSEYYFGGSISLRGCVNVEFGSTEGAGDAPVLVSNYNITPFIDTKNGKEFVNGGYPAVFPADAATFGIQLRNLSFGYKPVNSSQLTSIQLSPNGNAQKVYQVPRVIDIAGGNFLIDGIRYRQPSGSTHRMGGIENTTASKFSGLLAQNNRAESGDQSIVRYYLFVAGNAEGLVLSNNSWAQSDEESIIRIQSVTDSDNTNPQLGPSFVNISGNAFRDSGKSALRRCGKSYLPAERNTLTSNNSNWFGPQPDQGDDTNTTQYAIFDANVVDQSYLRICPNLKDAVIRNNIFRNNAHVFLREENINSAFTTIAERVWVVHNTREEFTPVDGTERPFIFYDNLGNDNRIRLADFHFANNLTTGGSTARDGVLLNKPGTNAWQSQIQAASTASTRWYIQSNVWRRSTEFGVDDDETTMSLSQWNTYVPSTAGTDDDIQPSSTQVLQVSVSAYKPRRVSGTDLTFLRIGSRALPDRLLSSTPTFSTRQIAWFDANQVTRPRTGATAGAAEA